MRHPAGTGTVDHAASGRTRILVVDDDADTRALTAEALSDIFAVSTAANRAQALDEMRRATPHAMVVDVMLGSESGWDVIRSVQADPQLRGVRIVVLSGGPRREPPPDVHPCAAYLSKPCRLGQLRELLRTLVCTDER